MKTPIDHVSLVFLKQLCATPRGRAFLFQALANVEGDAELNAFEAMAGAVSDPQLQKVIRRHAADEARHAGLLEALAMKEGVPRIRVPRACNPMDDLEQATGVLRAPMRSGEDVLRAYVLLQVIEERAVTQYPLYIEALRGLDDDAAAVLEKIQADELNHLRYCKAVTGRLAPSPAALAKTLKHYRAVGAWAFARNGEAMMREVVAAGVLAQPAPVRAFWVAAATLGAAVARRPVDEAPAPVEAAGALFTESTPEWYRELRRRVDAYFAERGVAKSGGPRAIAKALGLAAAALACYALVLAQVTGVWGTWLLATLQGTFMFLFALNSAHDATHGALVKSRRLNRLLWYCWDLVGISSWTTNLNHLRSHHVAPNVNGLDVAVGNEVLPLLRLHPEVPHQPWHRFQHLYFPLAYALGTMHKWFLLDVAELRRNSFGNREGHPDARRQLVLLVLFKLFTFTWAIAVPALVLPFAWWQLVIGFVSMHAVPGFIIALTFQVTHISEGNAFPALRADGRIEGSRALHNLVTNSDLVPQSRLLNWLTGGINVHLTHHLFPEVSHRYLPDLAVIVEAVAREYGVPYRKHESLWAAVVDHVRMLRKLAQPPARAERAAPILQARPVPVFEQRLAQAAHEVPLQGV